MPSLNELWAITDKEAAYRFIDEHYPNPNTNRVRKNEWGRRMRARTGAPRVGGRTKDDFIDEYLLSTPIAVIKQRRQELRRKDKENRIAAAEEALARARAQVIDDEDDGEETEDEETIAPPPKEEEEEECAWCGEPGYKNLSSCHHLVCRQCHDDNKEDGIVTCPVCSVENFL